MTSEDDVFNIPELLEQVLRYVNWKTLLLAQRVSRHWHIVISKSTILQSQLGLHPVARREFWVVRKNAIDMFIDARRIDESVVSSAASNELVLQRASTTRPMQMLAGGALGNPVGANFGTDFLFRAPSIPLVMLKDDPAASWRRMQCMQPPCLKLLASTTIFYHDSLMFRRIPGHRVDERLENHSGVTLGQIVDLVRSWKLEAPDSVDWDRELVSLTAVGMVVQDGFFDRLAR